MEANSSLICRSHLLSHANRYSGNTGILLADPNAQQEAYPWHPCCCSITGISLFYAFNPQLTCNQSVLQPLPRTDALL